MSETTIAEKSLEIRQETQEFANTRGRVANVLDDINETKANKSDVAQSLIEQNQNLQNHINDQANPHNVNKSQIGLGNVDNTSDTDKPISTATQTALNSLSTSTNTALGNKLDKPTVTVTNTTTYSHAVLVDANGNSAKYLAGDLGKNVANSALTSVANAGLTLGANWTLNTSGFYYSITGLNDASNDSTFNTLLTQNSAGRIAKSNGKAVFISLPTLLTDAEKTTWKTAMNGGWTTNTMSVGQISPPILDKSYNGNTWIVLKGANLNLNPANFSVEIIANDGVSVIATVPNSQVQLYTNGVDLIFYYNFSSFTLGLYKIRLWNGVAFYTTSLSVELLASINPIDFSGLTYDVLTYNNNGNPYASGSNGALIYKADSVTKPLVSESLIVCAQKSSAFINSNEDFYLEFNFSISNWSVNGGNNSTFYLGIMNAGLGLSLANQSSAGIRVSGRADSATKNLYIDNLGTVLGNSPGAITGTCTIIRRGSAFTLIVTSSVNSTTIYSKTNGTYPMSIYMANSNTVSTAESSISVVNAYKLS